MDPHVFGKMRSEAILLPIAGLCKLFAVEIQRLGENKL
jgi:hypothetical protein